MSAGVIQSETKDLKVVNGTVVDVISRKAVKGLLSYSLPYVATALDRVSF